MKKTVLQNLDLINSICSANMWGCGCDYLRLCYKERSDFIEDKLDLLDIDNSNFSTIELGDYIFTLKKIPTPNGMALNFYISYNDIVVPVAQFVKFSGSTRHNTNSYGKFDFYGSLFRLVDLGYFNKSIFLLLKTIISNEDPKVTRFDYRVDLFFNKYVEIPEPIEFCKYIHEQSNIDKHYQGKELTNWLVGSKTNGRYAVRYYDKLLDSDKKNKIFLYQDYFDYISVHRFEIEFQPNFLRGFNFYDFYNGIIQDKIESILGLNQAIFKGVLFYQYEDGIEIKEKDKSKYLRKYSTSCVRLAKNRINPLIQCYKSLFTELEESELQKNVFDFLDFIGSDRKQYKLLYERKKQLFLDLHKI